VTPEPLLRVELHSKVTSVSHCDSLKPDKDIRQTIYYMFD